MSFLENNFFLLAVTFGVFFFAKLLQKKTGLVLLNPILLTIALLIIFLKMTNISYETYNKGRTFDRVLAPPGCCCFRCTFISSVGNDKKQLLPILLSQLAGCIVGVISVVLIAKFMGASQEVILSLAPQIGYDSDCDGSNQSHWRYSVTDGGSCCGSRFIRSDLWF